jgi:hypothetical protein
MAAHRALTPRDAREFARAGAPWRGRDLCRHPHGAPVVDDPQTEADACMKVVLRA